MKKAERVQNKHLLTLVAALALSSACESSSNLGTLSSETDDLSTADLPVREAVTKIVAGANHTCVLFSTGIVRCWGDNSQQQLGVGIAPAQSPTPVTVLGVANAVDLFAGGFQSCAILAGSAQPSVPDRSVICWGNGAAPAMTGQNGVGEIQFGSDYTCTRGLNGFSGNVETAGSLSCAGGLDASQQLGDGSVLTAIQVVTGNLHTCTLQADSSVQCWGDDTLGELGNGSLDAGSGGSQANPSTIQIGAPAANYQATLLAAGNGFTCAAGFPNQDVSCWGDNALDEIGIVGPDQTSPLQVTAAAAPPVNALAIATNALARFVCVIQFDDTVWCWGDNTFGQLGIVVPALPNPSPVAPGPVLGRAHGIAVGQNHACALYYGNSTDVPTSSDPVPNPSPSPLPAPSPLPTSTDDDIYDVYCWGDNSDGQVGSGVVGGTQATPLQISHVLLYP